MKDKAESDHKITETQQLHVYIIHVSQHTTIQFYKTEDFPLSSHNFNDNSDNIKCN